MVLSLPWQDDASCSRIGLTDSMVYEIKLFDNKVEKSELLFLRTHFSNPDHTDSLRFGFKGVDSLACLEIQLPHSDWIITPLPIGDTSDMIRFGWTDGKFSTGFTRDMLERRLRELGLLFYIVDIGQNRPRTIASFEGEVFGISYPYILMRTGLTYLQDTTRYPTMNEYYSSSVVDCSDAYCIVVDVEKIILSASLPVSDLDGNGWVIHNLMLTPDGNLLIAYMNADGDKLIEDETKVFLVKERGLVTEMDYYDLIDSLFGKRYRFLEALHVNRIGWISNLILKDKTHYRAYGIGRSPRTVTEIYLATGDTNFREIILPGGSFANTVQGFQTPEGKIMYLWTPHNALSYFFPMSSLPANCRHHPAVSSLSGFPHELDYFDHLKLSDPWWELSPQRHWLTLYRENNSGRDAILVPAQALWDSTLLTKSRFCTIPEIPPEAELQFIRNEQLVCIRQDRKTDSKFLYRCQDGSPVRISLQEEKKIGNICFSPDGRNVSYLCNTGGKFSIKVRKLPD